MKVRLKGWQIGILALVIGFVGGAAYYFTINSSLPNASSLGGQAVMGTVANNVGSPAPDFTLTTVDLSSGLMGKNLTLADLKATGNPTIIYYWATWCPFCRVELTNLKSIYPNYQGKVNLLVEDVDVEENSSIIANEVSSRGYFGTYAIPNVPMLEAYKIYETSTKYVLSRNGTILYSGAGEITPQQWVQLFNTAVSS